MESLRVNRIHREVRPSVVLPFIRQSTQTVNRQSLSLWRLHRTDTSSTANALPATVSLTYALKVSLTYALKVSLTYALKVSLAYVSMAHFPLPRETFPVMKFAADQSAEFADCRDRLVYATMKARREFRDKYLMKLDARVWKVLKKKKANRKRSTSTSNSSSRASDSSSSSNSQNSSLSVFIPRHTAQVPKPSSSSSCSPILIGVGLIPGSLEDVMLGLTSSNTSAMRFAASYMHKDVLDVRVLSTLQSPTEAGPFEYLGFKWMVKGSSFAMKSFIRPRDFTYLESSGVHTDEQGHKVGHLMMHSVELTGCRSLKAQYGIVRGAISFCFLFSESLVTPGCVDVFFKGFVDPRGGVTERIALSAAADSIMACQNAPLCARMKKYSWMVREMRGQSRMTVRQSRAHNPRATNLSSHEAYLNTVETTNSHQANAIQASGASETSEEDAPLQDGCCTVCDVGFSAFTVSLACDICSFHVCSSCVQTVVMANGASSSSTTSLENISFCHHCVNAVEKLDSTRVARDDATHTLRQLSGANSISNSNDSFLLGASERIKLEPIKKRCQSVAGMVNGTGRSQHADRTSLDEQHNNNG